MEITENYLKELTDLLETNYGQIVGDPMPHYPAMVGFYLATPKDREYFLLGCNTDAGDWAVEAFDRGEQIHLFENSKNASPEEVAEMFGEMLMGCLIVVHI